MRARLEHAAMCAAALAASVLVSFWPAEVQDYARDAGPSLHPLINGDITAALAHQPAMGWVSILLRAPFAFFARHGSQLLEYRLGALACVFVVAALGLHLATRMRRAGRSTAACALAVGLAILGPMNLHALADGHPEELLAAAFSIAAVLVAAGGRRPVVAGLLLGLAVATKQWAVLAAGPVLLAAPRGRVALTAAAAAAGGALTLVPVLAGPHELLAPVNSISAAGVRSQPASIWWPLGHARHITAAGFPVEIRTVPQLVTQHVHALIVALGVALPAALAVKRRGGAVGTEAALTMLCLLFLLRCVLDPMDVGYYNAPLLLSLLTLESLHRRGIPLLTIVSSAVLGLLVTRLQWGSQPAAVAAIYLGWALPLAAYLAARIYAPTVISDFGKWLSRSLPSSVTTTRSSIRTPNAPGT